MSLDPIRNFHQVTPWLFRGGQPTHEGFQHLKNIGVKTVICLRWGPKIVEMERKAAESVGLEFVSLPLNYWNLPDQKRIDQFMAILDNAENHPIFVHCLHGADRTGILVAIYRMSREGWSVDQAYEEMKRCGFHRFRMRHFKWVLFSYARKASQPADPSASGKTLKPSPGNNSVDYRVNRS